jgi:hypothetical protein
LNSNSAYIEKIMKRLDEDKVSWVAFLRSIKFARGTAAGAKTECASHFAHFNPQAGQSVQSNAEDSYLIRSAN